MFVIKPSTMDVLDLTPPIEGYEPGHHLRFLPHHQSTSPKAQFILLRVSPQTSVPIGG